ncbi:hypothetical protein ACM67C_01310 [Bergeriella denitrificans]|uniref:hypothetical protein n=1 Tax=Bergeriella denitrificans TaxID=494 RepID=UPI0011C05841|nr:hypothetical protein [Bergeriella denitrificans]
MEYGHYGSGKSGRLKPYSGLFARAVFRRPFSDGLVRFSTQSAVVAAEAERTGGSAVALYGLRALADGLVSQAGARWRGALRCGFGVTAKAAALRFLPLELHIALL